MKPLLLLLISFLPLASTAQKNAEGMIAAEKSFAALAAKEGTKSAFLHFADSSGIVFENGQAVDAIEAWSKRAKTSMRLGWHPEYVEVAASGDFGYSSGPWQFRGNGSDAVIARGYFITVWHADAKGYWKFLLDLGTDSSPEQPLSGVQKVNTEKTKGAASTAGVLNAEKQFISAYSKDRSEAYNANLSVTSRLFRNELLPATTASEKKKAIDRTPAGIQFTVKGSGIAPSGDLAYVYGNTIIDGKHENYLRIWRREKNGWKIALEVLRY